MELENTQEDPNILKIEVSRIGNQAPMGPWEKQPSIWMRRQLTTTKAELSGQDDEPLTITVRRLGSKSESDHPSQSITVENR